MQNRSHHLPHGGYLTRTETERLEGGRGRFEVCLLAERILAAVFRVLIAGDVSRQVILAQFVFRGSTQQLQLKWFKINNSMSNT